MKNIENRIEGKVIAITGASSGIGEAIAIMLAAHGAKVVLGARRSDRLEELNNRIKASGGIPFIGLQMSKKRPMLIVWFNWPAYIMAGLTS